MDNNELLVRIDERVNTLKKDIKEIKSDLELLRTKTIAISSTIGVLVSIVIIKITDYLFK